MSPSWSSTRGRAVPARLLARRFRRLDIHRLAEWGMRLAVRALRASKVRRVVLDIDSTLVESGVRIAERTYEGFRDSISC